MKYLFYRFYYNIRYVYNHKPISMIMVVTFWQKIVEKTLSRWFLNRKKDAFNDYFHSRYQALFAHYESHFINFLSK